MLKLTSLISWALKSVLTLKHLETHGRIVSFVATNALVLKHQAISIPSADYTIIVWDQFYMKYYTYAGQH